MIDQRSDMQCRLRENRPGFLAHQTSSINRCQVKEVVPDRLSVEAKRP